MPDLKKMLTLEALSAALPSWLKRSTKPEYNADEIDSTNTTNQFVSASDKDNWNAKGTYSKPSDGIPKSDLSSIVQTSLEKADSALQSETDPTVPSWAKQTNKPSYTQDEVTDGTTYKRVTQTEKNAWSGKQNALSTTQMQAVNSGITSAGVAQISTNQTNILYGLEHGSKNQLNFDGWYAHGTGVTWKLNDDKTITATGTATNLNYIVLQLNGSDINVDNLCDGLHYLSGCPTGGNFDTKYAMYVAKGNYTSVDTGTGVLLPSTSETELRAVIKIASGFAIPSGGITFKPMICLKSVYDAYSEYQSYGAPNYDLTRLEAEDRAGLVEVVDSGAKNIANIPSTQTIGSTTFTKDANEWITSNSSTPDGRQWSDANKNVSYTVKAGSYIIYGETPNTNTGAVDAYVIVNGSLSKPLILTANSNGAVEVNLTSAGTIGLMYKPYSTNKVRYMICTKAAFGVSNKFVPYRGVIPSNIVLAQTIATTPTETIVPSLTITIPAYYRADIKACLNYSNGVPVTIRILDSDSIAPSTTLGLAQQESANYKLSSLCTTALTSSGGADKKIYFSAQSANSSNNTMIVIVNLYPAN